MARVIGIPRGLLYYYFAPYWETFFKELGYEILLSSETNKNVLDNGIKYSVDEACLPVKVFFGHVIDLKDKNVDYIFIPRMISFERKRYLCPKFLGLPDFIENMIKDLPPVIEIKVNNYKNRLLPDINIYKTGFKLTKNIFKISKAHEKAKVKQREFEAWMRRGYTYNEAMRLIKGQEIEKKKFNFKIGVLSHAYNVMDNYISMKIIDKIRDMGAEVVLSGMLEKENIEYGASKLPKDMFWSYGRELYGAARYFLDYQCVDGVIVLSAFGCGTDSIIKEIIEREYKRRNTIPLLSLTVDEHTGEAGILTRLEAYMDLMQRKEKQNEDNISSYGDNVNSCKSHV